MYNTVHISGGIPIKVNINANSLGRTVLELWVLNVLGAYKKKHFPHRGQTVRDRGPGVITIIVLLVEPYKFGFLHFFVGAILTKLIFSSGRSSAPLGVRGINY